MYEMGKQFRNESIDMTHNPEFTSCEFYQACPHCPFLHYPNSPPKAASLVMEAMCICCFISAVHYLIMTRLNPVALPDKRRNNSSMM